MKKPFLKITNKGLLIGLLFITLIGFLIARFPSIVQKFAPTMDAGKINLYGESIYTVGMMAIIGLLGFAALPVVPIVAVLMFLTVATLGYHLYKKFN